MSENLIKIQFIDNQYDNKMKEETFDKASFSNVVDMIVHPMIVESKDKIRQWKWCSVKGEMRKTENIGKTRMLMLDYDSNNYSIKQFEKDFGQYQYILHTSYSYDGVKQKFRVILFLDKEYVMNKLLFRCHDESVSPYHLLLSHFPHIDPASFVRAQFFKVPAVKGKDAPYYYHFNRGDLFGFSPKFMDAYTMCEYRETEYLSKMKKQAEIYKQKFGGDTTKAIKFIEESLNSEVSGQRHNKVFSLACWYKHIGGTYSEFSCVNAPTWADESYYKQMKQIENEWENLR